MPSINVEYSEPYKVLFEPYSYIGFKGGRGGAKSHNVAEYVVLRALQSKLRILCVREIQLSIKQSVKYLIEEKIRKFQLEQYFKSTQDSVICIRTGSEFIFTGLRDYSAHTIKSLEAIDICWIEEGQSITHRSIDILMPTIRKENALVIATWNPERPPDEKGKPGDPIEDFLAGSHPPDDSVVKHVTWRDNLEFSNFSDKQRRKLKQKDPLLYLHVWEGDYLKFADALVFKNWRIGRFEPPSDVNFMFGADWGFSEDPTVLVRFWVNMDERILYIDQEAYQSHVKIQHTPALFLQVPEADKGWAIIADSENPHLITYIRQQGFNIRAAKKGPKSVETGVKWLQDFDIVIHERCDHAINEFANYQYKVDKWTDEVTPILQDKNNHLIDAVRYGAEKLIRRGSNTSRKILIA